MGIFGKLFEKKICDICGNEIGLLGNRKLENGNCCKECAEKLSPWFSDRKQSTVDEIKEQLAYREANRDEVANFSVTREFGEDTKVYIDDTQRKFMVTSSTNFREANPDVLSFDQVTSCVLDIDEDRDEVYREVKNADGETEEESYNPPRYKYSYTFHMTIYVNHPYFDDMRFELTRDYIEVAASSYGQNIGFGFNPANPMNRMNAGVLGIEGSVTPPTQEDKRRNPEYAKYEDMGLAIKEVLTGETKNTEETEQQTEDTQKPAFCPWCGSPLNDAGTFCPNCGGKLTD